MQLKDYIKGDRSGKEANRLEREAMNDPFLQEALEGFDAVGGDHAEIIERLENRITIRDDDTFGIPMDDSVDVQMGDSVGTSVSIPTGEKVGNSVPAPQKTVKLFLYWSAAATILFLIGFGAYFLFEKNRPNEAAIVMVQPEDNKMQIPATSQNEVEMESVEDKSLETESPEPVLTLRSKPEEAAPTVKNPIDIVSVTEEMEVVVVVEDDRENRMEMYVQPNVTQEEEFDEDVIFIPVEELNDTRARSSRAATTTTTTTTTNTSRATSTTNTTKASRATSPKSETRQSVVVAEEVTLSRKSKISESDRNPITFGEKEFQAYCRQKANKKVCGGKKVSVKVTFFIDEAGKPTNIQYEKYTCEDAVKEIQNLLKSSPAWTTPNKKVTMTVRW